MSELFIETLHSWQNFYFMIGGAAAALMGLMFVALSFGLQLIDHQTRDNVQNFVTPSIVYFTSVVLIAGVMLVPTYMPTMLAVILGVGGAAGCGRTLFAARTLIAIAKRHGDFNTWDWLAQIILPVVSYLLMILAAFDFTTTWWSTAFLGLWLSVLLMLICGISNTWSLVTWIIEQRTS